MAYIHKTDFGCNALSEIEANFAKPISQLRKIRTKPDFRKTTAHAEKRIYINAARYGSGERLTKTQRNVLVKFVNLWIYHRGKSGFITKALDQVADALGHTVDTIKKAVSHLMKLGIVRRVNGGLGRGNVSSYIVDTPSLVEVMSAGLVVKSCGEMVTMDGEIKGVETPSAYKEDIYTLARSGPKGTRGVQWIDLGHMDWDGVQSLFRRIRSRVTGWGSAATAKFHKPASNQAYAGGNHG